MDSEKPDHTDYLYRYLAHLALIRSGGDTIPSNQVTPSVLLEVAAPREG